MRRIVFLLAAIFAIALTSCAGDTAFPTATGKGTVRAINSIKTAPGITFMIEEILIGAVEFKSASAVRQFDDLDYIFNFEARFAGESELRRISSQSLKVGKDKDYIFVIGGALASPTIAIWERDIRTWTETDTGFEANFGHSANALGPVDVYFAASGIVPVSGQEIGTVAFGEVLPPADYAAGNYVIIFAEAGNYSPAGEPLNVLFTSRVVTLAAQSAITISMFDADANELGPMSVRVFNSAGPTLAVPDESVASTLRFFHTSMALATSDIYDDEALTSLLVADHAFGEITGDITIAPGLTPITYTTAGDTGVILFEDDLQALLGAHGHVYIVGETDALSAVLTIPNRRSIETRVRFSFLNTATNHDSIDIYIIVADTTFDEQLPVLTSLTVGSAPSSINLQPGGFDMYLTPAGDKTIIITGPIRLDTALGDVIDVIALDAVDPSTVDVLFVPPP